MIDYKEQYGLVDKSSWRDGVWKQEPDRVSWVDPETGYHCLVRRNHRMGFFCGYVAVEKGHPFYRNSYQDNGYYVAGNIDVHGGITYSEECDGDGVEGICHVTKEDDAAWWFGFDCGHAWDVSPGDSMPAPIELIKMFSPYQLDVPSINEMMVTEDSLEAYRDLAYCTDQVKSLAKQLKQVEVEKREDNA